MTTESVFAATNQYPKPKMENGEIFWTSSAKAATSNITYATIGYQVTKTRTNGNVSAHSQRVVRIGYQESFVANELGADDNIAGNIVTQFTVPQDLVTKVLANANMPWAQGETIYLQSIMEVRQNGVKIAGPFQDLNAIKSSQPWARPSDLDQYWDIDVKLDFADPGYPANKVVFINGKQVSSSKYTDAMPGATVNVPLDATYTYQGNTLSLAKSDITHIQSKGEPENVKPGTVTTQTFTQAVGGYDVNQYYEYSPTLTVQYYDLDTQKIISTDPPETVATGTSVSKLAKVQDGKTFVYSEVMVNGGAWGQRAVSNPRSVTVTADTTLRFYYASGAVGNKPNAVLVLTAQPDAIKSGQKATVKFILDASASTAPDRITKYEFWFGDNDSFDNSPDYTGATSIKTVSKPNVEPESTWYGKVRITDSKGNTAEAEAEVKIGELPADPPPAVADAVLRVNPVSGIGHIVTSFVQDEYVDYYYYMDVVLPSYLIEADGTYRDLLLPFTLNGSESSSTNGVGNYSFIGPFAGDIGGYDTLIDNGDNPLVESVDIRFKPQEWIDKTGGIDTGQTIDGSLEFYLRVTDSVDSTATDRADMILFYKYHLEKGKPSVSLSINKNQFAVGETAIFTPGFVENANTLPIAQKNWRIYSPDETVSIEGVGEIPHNYDLNFAPGAYIAEQSITYRDGDNDVTASAEVDFTVIQIRPPDVSIASDKTVYTAPTTGLFTVVYDEDLTYAFWIYSREYRLVSKTGTVLMSGEGTFPNSYIFDENFEGGFYTAEQTIYWYEYGELKSKTASCDFRVITPKPSTDFAVNMMTTTAPSWKRIDVSGESGKQYKRIQIDLSPSTALNASLDNPYPVLYTSGNTQIQITPLDASGAPDYSKNGIIYTPNAADKQVVGGVVTFTGKQSIDVRFDKPGTYRVSARVANQYYIGNWVTRNIVIREELPPKVSLRFENVAVVDGVNTVYRESNDLRVRFRVNANAVSQDDDTPDAATAKLSMQYDYNADGNPANDGVHSGMTMTAAVNNLQSYATITKSADMRTFDVTMYNSAAPILGLMNFEYEIEDKPTIPNFTGGSMPGIPRQVGNTASMSVSSKRVLADNRAGNIQVEMGSTEVVDIIIIMGDPVLHFDLNTLKQYYGDRARIYLVDMDGNRQLMN